MNSIVLGMLRPAKTLAVVVALVIGDPEQQKILVTSSVAKDVIVTVPYVCQINSHRHIKVRAPEKGYLEQIAVKAGQAVKKGDLLFKIRPTLDQAKLKPAGAGLNFTNVTAPFDGIVDRLQEQLGSVVKQGDILTNLFDNSVMWVYFTVPEKRYLEFMAGLKQPKEDQKIELVLANGKKFPQIGKMAAIDAKFDNKTGTIAFRADFPNPDRLLRHGQTGTVLINRPLKSAIVIPQRATFEKLAKWYVYVVGKDDVAHQREIVIQNEMDDVFVIKRGVDVGDKIVLEGIRQVRDGEKVEYEFRHPDQVIGNPSNLPGSFK